MPDWLITRLFAASYVARSSSRRGKSLIDLGIIRDGAILVHENRIVAAGTRRRIENLPAARKAEKLDLQGRVVLPGFVDSHTHLIFPRSRALRIRRPHRRRDV